MFELIMIAYLVMGLITNIILIRYVEGWGDDLFFEPAEFIICTLFWPFIWFLATLVLFLLFPADWLITKFVTLCRYGVNK